MDDVFGLPLLKAISDWQSGGDSAQGKRRGEVLKAACAQVPVAYRSCGICCFRQVALPKGGVWELIGEGKLSEKISSWTLDMEVAKHFKGGVPPQGQGYQGVIFCLKPAAESVIINLRSLYNDQVFLRALDRHKAEIPSFYTGAGRYRNSQSEVVLELDAIGQADIFSMGGHSDQFEKLVDVAAEQIYGPNATSEQREALLLASEQVRNLAGPVWLNHEATTRVVKRLKPEVAKLHVIKKLQDRI